MRASGPSSRDAASAPQPAMAPCFRKSRREVPFLSAMEHLQLLVRDVEDARGGARLLLEELHLVGLLHLRDEALRVVLVAEVARSPHARRDALGEQPVRESVRAEGALARRAQEPARLVVAPPRDEVLERRRRLVLLELRRAVRVEGPGVERAGAVGARLHALPASDALLVVDGDDARGDALRLLPGRLPLLRARAHARRLVALH